MNGSTNVQLSIIATLVVAFSLGVARWYAPEFVASLGASFPEIFTGGVIATLGLLLKADAGVKFLPGTGN